jgi:4-hydroxythreonine-4-phosphate dehydrogenase
MGDPLGIGPEIVVKALSVWRGRPVVVFGDVERLEAMRRMLVADVSWQVVESLAQAEKAGELQVLVVPGPAVTGPWGAVMAEAGQASYQYIVDAVNWHRKGGICGLVTAPIHKEAIHRAGVSEPGHTEILARLLAAPRVAMMLVGGGLRVTHISTHVSLVEAIERVTADRIQAAVHLTAEILPQFGLVGGLIAVAGLNPHNGEHGLFGDVEERIIRPAVEQLAGQGMQVVGPIAADTVFARAKRQEFSAVIALYHDQGHIPVKLLAFDQAVNLTLGLPMVRTSVDHGTAMDIAGQGVANAESLLAALSLADRLTQP